MYFSGKGTSKVGWAYLATAVALPQLRQRTGTPDLDCPLEEGHCGGGVAIYAPPLQAEQPKLHQAGWVVDCTGLLEQRDRGSQLFVGPFAKVWECSVLKRAMRGNWEGREISR